MKLARAAVLVLAAAHLSAPPSPAQTDDHVHERIFEISPFAGALLVDENTGYSSTSGLVGLRGTLNNSPRWALEGTLAFSPGQGQTVRSGMLQSYDFHIAFNSADQPLGPNAIVFTNLVSTQGQEETSSNLFLGGANVLLHLSEGRFRPFVSLGAGFLDDLSNSEGDPPGPFSNIYMDIGGGFRYSKPSGFGFRLDIRDLVMRRDDLPQANPRAELLAAQRDLLTNGGADGVVGREPYNLDDPRGKRWLNNYMITASVTFPFGWAWKDGDGDMIEDRFDNCLTTAPDVVVDATGCGLDSDQDGIFDGLDVCEGTPLGATVDVQGCPSDTDGDGILDGIDQCADTPVGALVNAQGCPSDADGDGVLDGLDSCNETPLGALIDEKGCVKDPLEAMLLRRELIRMDGVEFESGRPELRPLSYHYVNKMGRLLERWTGNEERPLRVEIGVYTDGVGAADFNLDLSQQRAETIRMYMLENFYRMGQNNLVPTGYGEAFPIADDGTAAGRATNRRVEIRVVGDGDPPETYTPAVTEDEFDLDLDGLDLEGLDLPDMPALPDLEMPDIPEPEMPDSDAPDSE
ncbi:MAG TPA: OmpA family protein [bacterium]|nr:OmpA family protein [bacterium]